LRRKRDDVHVDRAVGHEALIDVHVVALRGIDDLLAGEDPARLTGHEQQDAKLRGGQIDRPVLDQDLMTAGVQDQLTDLDARLAVVAFALFASAARL